MFERLADAIGLRRVRRSARRLRVGVDIALSQLSPATGHGRVWSTAIDLLEPVATVVHETENFAGTLRPDVWLSNGHNGPIPVREPVVTMVHEARWVEPVLAADCNSAFLSSIVPNTAQAVQQATRVLTVSFASARNVAQLGISADRIDVVPLGVDLNVFRPGLSGGRQLVAARTGDDRPYIICVASLFKGKNLLLLRDAVDRLSTRGFPHRLVLVTQRPGDGSDSAARLDELKLTKGLPPEIFQDMTEEDLAGLVAGSSAFCLPSRFEGFGLPALEALACGVPVVVSDGGALPEIVADAGLVVSPTLEAVENALAMILEDAGLAQDLSSRGRRRAEAFPWERMKRGWMSCLERAAQSGAS